MARYIDAVKAAEMISEALKIDIFDLVDIFADIPTAGVCCKDCKNYEPHGNGTAGVCRNKKCNGLRYATDFCSYGRRKDEISKTTDS